MPFWLEVILIKTEEIIRLIEAIKNSDFTEFTLENEGFRVSLLRKKGEEQITSSPPLETAGGKEIVPGPSATVEDNLVEVNAPMVGTFYRAPSPGEEPFVKVGDTVKKDDTLCILEAMKLMNEIKADQGGEIVSILVENGEMVEYGQTLFQIKGQS